MIRRPPRSTQSRSSAASDVYKRQLFSRVKPRPVLPGLPEVLPRSVIFILAYPDTEVTIDPRSGTEVRHGRRGVALDGFRYRAQAHTWLIGKGSIQCSEKRRSSLWVELPCVLSIQDDREDTGSVESIADRADTVQELPDSMFFRQGGIPETYGVGESPVSEHHGDFSRPGLCPVGAVQHPMRLVRELPQQNLLIGGGPGETRASDLGHSVLGHTSLGGPAPAHSLVQQVFDSLLAELELHEGILRVAETRLWERSVLNGAGDVGVDEEGDDRVCELSLIHISEPTRLGMISYA